MSRKQSFAPLILGLVLVVLGGLLLAHNLGLLQLDGLLGLRLLLPTLFLAWGLYRLIRHFTWSVQELAQHPARSGLLSGMFFTSLGVIWYLHIFDVLNFTDFVGLYWPLLLVLFGLGKVVDFYRLQGRLQFRITEAFGVVFVIVFGLTCGLIARAHFPLIEFPFTLDDDYSLADFAGRKFSWSSEGVFSAANIEELEIVNIYGDVKVEPGNTEEIEVDLTKEIRATDEEEARELAELVKITFAKEGNRLLIGTNRREVGLKKARFTTHLSVAAPKNVRLQVRNGYGNVRVARFENSCNISNSYGDIDVEAITGDVTTENKYRPTRLRGIQGNVKVTSSRGRVEIEGISANAEVSTDYQTISAKDIGGTLVARNRFGEIRVFSVLGEVQIGGPGSEVRVNDIGQRVTISNSHEPIAVEDLRAGLELKTSFSNRVRIKRVSGAVNLEAAHTAVHAWELGSGITLTGVSTSVDLKDLVGSFEIATSLRPVKIQGFDGKGRVQNEFGDVTLTAREPLNHGLVVVNKNAKIVLSVPASSNLSLTAEALGGSIVSDFGNSTQPNSTVLKASIGRGGPHVSLQTTHASIRIRKD